MFVRESSEINEIHESLTITTSLDDEFSVIFVDEYLLSGRTDQKVSFFDKSSVDKFAICFKFDKN